MSFVNALGALKGNIDLALTDITQKVTRNSVAVGRTITAVYPGDTLEFTITNYDSEISYTVATSLGTANLVVTGQTAKVQYTAPANPGNEVLQINERQIAFTILPRVVVKPTLVAPTEAAVDVSVTPTLTSSAFTSTPDGYDTHEATDWEIATDAGFTSPVWQPSGDAVNLETITVADGFLSGATQYYARVRHKGATLGYSEWSDTVTFTTVATDLVGTEIAKLIASDGASSDRFGEAVSLNAAGTIMAIGAMQNASNRGAVYIFTETGGSWSQTAKLVSDTLNVGDRFGYSVSLNDAGDRLVVGAPYDDEGYTEAGAAFVFDYSGGSWSQTVRLLPNVSYADGRFGRSVAISGDGTDIMVGAWRDDSHSAEAGAVHFYELNGATWNHIKRVNASDANSGTFFGFSVAMSADGAVAVVGAYNHHAAASSAGAAYTFSKSTGNWQQTARLLASDAAAGDEFGYSVDISADGSRLIVGARYFEDNARANAGGAYIFEDVAGVWTQKAILRSAYHYSGANAGWSVSISGDGTQAVLGVPYNTYPVNAGGAVTYFSEEGGVWGDTLWSQVISSADLQNGDVFGWSVAFAKGGTVLAVGAPLEGGKGAAYIFN